MTVDDMTPDELKASNAAFDLEDLAHPEHDIRGPDFRLGFACGIRFERARQSERILALERVYQKTGSWPGSMPSTTPRRLRRSGNV